MNKASVFGKKAAEPGLETINNVIFDIIRLNMNEFWKLHSKYSLVCKFRT